MAQYRLWCTLCGLSGVEALPASTGDPTNELVALQEHVIGEHGESLGVSPTADPSTVHQSARRHELSGGSYSWSINDVIWLRAEPLTREDAEV